METETRRTAKWPSFCNIKNHPHIMKRGDFDMDHEISVVNREKIIVTAVTSVDGFDETCICVNLKENQLIIYGRNLHIEGLDMDDGVLTAAGYIENIGYARKKEKKSLKKRFFK